MITNHSNAYLWIGLASIGLSLVVAGIGLIRRRAVEAHVSPGPEIPAIGDSGSLSGSEQVERPGQNPHPVRPVSPLVYFALVFVLAVPLWLFGGKPLPIPVKLPVSALGIVIPLLAASILTIARGGFTDLKALFSRILDYRKIKNPAWFFPILILSPLIALLSYGVMRLAGLPLPDPQIPWLMAPLYLVVFFVAGIFEELGWMGYVFDPLQSRWGALKASLLLGLVWAVFHLIPDLQNQQAFDWILWQRLGTILLRIVMAWIYNNTGRSVFSMILFHSANNLAWALFPNNGSNYDPFIIFMLYLPVAAFIVSGWDSQTLTHFRLARPVRAAAVRGQNRAAS